MIRMKRLACSAPPGSRPSNPPKQQQLTKPEQEEEEEEPRVQLVTESRKLLTSWR